MHMAMEIGDSNFTHHHLIIHTNNVGDKLLFNFGTKISALIDNFTCEITILFWQLSLQCKNNVQV